jgi:hypothetical protein
MINILDGIWDKAEAVDEHDEQDDQWIVKDNF